MEAILAGITTVTTVVGNVFTAMTSNAYIAVLFGASLLGIGIGVFGQLRNAARG